MQNICAVFDIGKTNKKLLAFNESFDVVYEHQVVFEEVLDDDGDICDDLKALTEWVLAQIEVLKSNSEFTLKALNFSAYGASLVHIGANLQPVTPLYNYLKVLPRKLKDQFLAKYGPAEDFFRAVASPNLGLLNSGLQLYWLKYEKVEFFKHVRYSLHLPQYLSFLFSGKAQAEFTSIGCHTALWDFDAFKYHNWVEAERLKSISLEPVKASETVEVEQVVVGPGMHDSSAALVPYLKSAEDFVLISTGTWCITLNPNNHTALTNKELENDGLNFISFEGKTVRAARLFSGNEHERQVKHLASYFGVSEDYYKNVKFDYKLIQQLRKAHKQVMPDQVELGELRECPFVERNINMFRTYDEAYHQFIMDLVTQQIASTKQTFGTNTPRKIFVDGGFSRNEIFMNLLSEAFFNIEVYASEVAQASALGAALVISDAWTKQPFETSKLKLKRYY